ncbi:hypothetical protein PV325_013981, partial [Microctonus aethiopoides]
MIEAKNEHGKHFRVHVKDVRPYYPANGEAPTEKESSNAKRPRTESEGQAIQSRASRYTRANHSAAGPQAQDYPLHSPRIGEERIILPPTSMAEKTTNETDPDISGILRLIEESDKEGEKLLTSSLAFINSRRPLTTYTIPRLNPRYGKKRGDWMMEEPAVTKPTACRTAPSPGKQSSKKPRVT